jgi:hypothetical protein
MLIKRIALVVAIFTLSLTTPVSAAEAGVIEGRLVNGTAGGSSSVADLDITLKLYQDSNELDLSKTAQTDAEGRFVFDRLDTEPSYDYHVNITYQQAEYQSGHISFVEGETTKSVVVTVYDSTTSDEAIQVATAHTVIYIEQGVLNVWDYFLFENMSDLTYIGSKEVTPTPGGMRETLKFSLPEGASELQPGGALMDCCIHRSEEGFIDTTPVLPGAKETFYSYRVDYNSGTYTFSHEANYPTVSFDLFVQGEGTNVAGDQLVVQEPMIIEDIWYKHLSSPELALGDILNIRLSGLPSGVDNQQTVLWVTLTLVLLTAGFGFSYLMRKKRLRPVSLQGSLAQKRQRLLVELAQLDDDFEVGKIQEESYHRLRARRKAQLIELTQGSKEKSGDR